MELNEIRKWKDLAIPKNKVFVQRDRDIFIFQILTGCHNKDLRILRMDQLMNDGDYGMFIPGKRDKDGNDIIILLFKFPDAMEIMERNATDAKSELVFGPDAFIL